MSDTKQKQYSNIRVDSEAIKASLKETGFKQYIYNGKVLDPNDHLNDSMIYMLNSQKMYFPEWDANRMVCKPKTLWQKIKSRLSHAWYALKGGECD